MKATGVEMAEPMKLIYQKLLCPLNLLLTPLQVLGIIQGNDPRLLSYGINIPRCANPAQSVDNFLTGNRIAQTQPGQGVILGHGKYTDDIAL